MVAMKAKDLYSQRKFWRLLLMGCASVIILFSLIFTYHLARTIEKDEKARVQEMAKAYQILVSSTDEYEINDALKLTRDNQTIPVIWTTYANDILDSKNLQNENILKDSIDLKEYLNKLKNLDQVVEFSININEEPQLLYYDASKLLKMVRIYPYLIFSLVFIFLIIALVAVSLSRTAVQNQLWAGMAKETAHQLGTPISSLSAWVDFLEPKFEGTEDAFIIDELKKDIGRLEIVADRFSKIGSKPTLAPTDVILVIEKIIDYMSKRAAKSVEFKIIDKTEGDHIAMLNASLFEWVLENLIKNALDAMEGMGKICVVVDNISGVLTIDISDTGKGIESQKVKSIFEPGFSTKKRGWGLGLTLSKRIIEEYHKGKIIVKESILGKGTTFRIEFRKDVMN